MAQGHDPKGNGEPQRDLVVIGASAGGIEPLRTLVAGLPADFPAAVLVVMHMRAGGTSALSMILDRAGRLPAVSASDGMPLEPGRIYVGRPDHHLLADPDRLVLSKGPTENGHRPAVNALFRSAAVSAGPRTVGVVLSGALDDGALGLRDIADRGGTTVVQDPHDALYSGMPASALRLVTADHVVPAAAIADVLVKVVGQVVELQDAAEPSPSMVLEDKIARDGMRPVRRRTGNHDVALEFSCPDCNGTLAEVEPDSGAYRCRVGHAWSQDALLTAQDDELRRALWIALRSLDEKGALARKMVSQALDRGQDALRERFGEIRRESESAAEVLRQFLLSIEDTTESAS
ncbi:chemotaxis protein CheB [Labedaea rhizosphaerae]|uniref:protein-glutamate methylesterase n=1 Tax=Labedaea rhizosphaerae TaxID=598644 RepID=A0A4R6S8A6_LABRH|nr:chemotaxis protein CheB [Labedaea rhizosphaerae]TDP95075.1 two-component system chemotaxis response regulator CheB [Labedaea rhizosphaerae]